MKERTITKHAQYRINERKIPDALVQEALTKGKRSILLDRNAYEYRLNNVLGLRGRHLVVITGLQGEIITSFVDTPIKSRQRRSQENKRLKEEYSR
jgi:hypothetical protein